jgi:tetratricopeptide (TPR) repeat protein
VQQTVELKCTGCGARVTTGQKDCEWCHKPVVINSFNSVYSMPIPEVSKYANSYKMALSDNPDDFLLNNSAAMCYLKLKLYDKALLSFERAIENNFDNSETYFYAAICLLQGKKAFLHQRPTIDKILEYINSALMIEPRGIYYYFLAYIKYDYFERKYFKTSPTFREVHAIATDAGFSEFDADQLFGILSVARPDYL